MITTVNKQQLLDSLVELMKIRSVKTDPVGDKPFGEGVFCALDYTLKLAESFGFETKNYDNYVGEVIWGEGEPFGILCHLDIVPEGSLEDWITPPYSPIVKDGKLYGRGALDDKSAAISALFCMKALKDAGFKPTRKVQLILGCDEESGWGCIDHYREVAVLPEEGISPDADFPVIYAEKGIAQLKYRLKKCKGLIDISGGTRANVVCDHVVAVVENVGGAKDFGLTVSTDGKTVENFGVAAHGSTPEKGVNALDKLFAFLESKGYLESGTHAKFFLDKCGVKKLVDETGYLTFSPDVISCDDEYVYLTVDVRYPCTLDKEFVFNKLAEVGDYTLGHCQEPLFSDKNGGLVKTLCEVYSSLTGDTSEPIAIGGGTYARALKRGVAFGPARGEEGDSIHKPNEYVTLETLDLMTDVYLETIYRICCK